MGDPVRVLRRWESSGGLWRVTARGPAGLEIVLLTCTGDEEMGTVRSADPALLAYIGERDGSDC